MTHAPKFWADRLPQEYRAEFYARVEQWTQDYHAISPGETIYYKMLIERGINEKL